MLAVPKDVSAGVEVGVGSVEMLELSQVVRSQVELEQMDQPRSSRRLS